MISLIASVGPNLELGLNNQLIYHSKEDMDFFKNMTKGHKVVMGLNTFKSIGKPLKNRDNYVVTHHQDQLPVGVVQVADFQRFLEAYSEAFETVFVIGGASVYRQAIDHAEHIYLTEFDEPKEADAFFPDFYEPVYYNKKKIKDIPGGAIYDYEFAF